MYDILFLGENIAKTKNDRFWFYFERRRPSRAAPRKVLFLVSYSHFTHITNITYENGRPWLYIGYQQLQQIIKMRFRSKCHISVF